MLRKRRWRRVFFFLAGLFIAYWVGCYYLAAQYVRPRAKNETGPPKGFVALKDPDAWMTAATQNRFLSEAIAPETFDRSVHRHTVFILVHGYSGSQSGFNHVAETLAQRGYQVVVPAMPGHDDRTEETCGFGLRESEAVLNTVKWVRSKQTAPPKIVLVGVSMGGAACWLAAEKDPTIDAVVTEGCFARLEVATNRWFNRKAPGASIFLRPVIWFASNMSGVSPSDVNPVEAAAKWKGKRALIVHGADDTLFAEGDARELADASGADLWIVPGATHAHCSDVAFDEYLKRLEAIAR